MKQNLFTAAAIVLLSSFSLPSKQVIQISKFIPGTYSFMTDGDLTGAGVPPDLEKTTAVYQTGKGKTTSPTVTLTGLKSSFRLSTGAVLKFRTQFDTGPMPVDGFVLHPSTDIVLYKLNVDKKNRTSTTPLQIVFTQIDKTTFRIDIPAGVALDKGEYTFIDKTTLTSTGVITVWCFGID